MPDRKHRTQVQFICDCCGKEATKAKSEYERNIRLDKKNFCSRSCAARCTFFPISYITFYICFNYSNWFNSWSFVR